MENEMRERAIKAILDYFESEYGVEDRELEDDPSKIGFIYTTDETDEHEFQWYADVNKMEMWLEIDGEPSGYREPFEVEFFEDAPNDVFDTYTGIAEEVLEEMEAKDGDK